MDIEKSASSGKENLIDLNWDKVFKALCLYRDYKIKFSEVILNYYHRTPQEFNYGQLIDILAQFEADRNETTFTALFDYLKFIDQALGIDKVEQVILENGILLIGESTWKAFSLIPGEYPFANLRFIELNEREIGAYRNSPVVEFDSEDSLKIATCTLGKSINTTFAGTPNLRGGEYGIYSDGVANQGKLNDAIISSLQWSANAEADVVLFPELCVNQEGLTVIEDWIQVHTTRENLAPKIIVGGSFYQLFDDGYRNRSTIYLTSKQTHHGPPWQTIYYDKHVPFSGGVPEKGEPTGTFWDNIYQDARDHGDKIYIEDFVSGSDITLLNTSKGMFGFAICRDVLDLAGVGNPLERYLNFVDFLMIISFNEGSTTLFEAQGEDFARWHNCVVVYVNTSQGLPDDNTQVKMGYCIYPYDKSSSGIGGKIYYLNLTEAQQSNPKFGHLDLGSVPSDGNILYNITVASRKK